MRRLLTLVLLVSVISPFCGQVNGNLSKHQLSLDFGSFRNRYFYPITDVKYSSPLLMKDNLRFSTRIRSYGTLFFYSKSAYDFTPVVEYYFTKTSKPVYFSAGLGLDTRLRFVNDERSEARNSAEPLLSFTFHGNHKKLSFNSPFWTRFYSNGISYSLLPESSFQIGNRFLIFLRYELSYFSVYKVSTHEWRRDCLIGAHILL